MREPGRDETASDTGHGEPFYIEIGTRESKAYQPQTILQIPKFPQNHRIHRKPNNMDVLFGEKAHARNVRRTKTGYFLHRNYGYQCVSPITGSCQVFMT